MFQISALPRDQFEGFFQLDDDELAARGAKRYRANAKPGFPWRVSLEDAEPGERVRYVHVHFAAPGCYACRVDRAGDN